MENSESQPAIAIVCGGRPAKIRRRGQCGGLCGKEDARLVTSHPDSGWYAPITYCGCGDSWGDGELLPRPFAKGWRKRAQAEFEDSWTSAHPEGSKPVYDENHHLTGVAEPSGRFVVYGGHGVDVQSRGQCLGECSRPDARLVVEHVASKWFSPVTLCECGDMWSNDKVLPRPMILGWREKARAEFEERYAAAYPHECEPVYDEHGRFVGLSEPTHDTDGDL